MTHDTRPLIAANWKMNGDAAFATGLAGALAADQGVIAAAQRCDVVLAPPYPWLERVRQIVAHTPLQLGAQDCSPHPDGAYTGDVSAPMLVSAGCGWVIVGHSERRAGHHERSSLVKAKAEAALASGLGVILCVGEDQSIRAQGDDAAQRATIQQLSDSWPCLEGGAAGQKIVVAYEPVWAIGTGLTALPEQIERMHHALSDILVKSLAADQNIRIVYGGSVKAASAASILALHGVDGVLVGGASLRSDEFAAIVCASARQPA